MLGDLQGKLTHSKALNERLKDSVFQLNQRIDEQNDFSLEGNEYALRYFEKNLSIQNITGHVKDQLYETNLLREKNNLIPYAAMDRTFLINKVRFLTISGL